MKIKIIKIGKPAHPEFNSLANEYGKRLQRYAQTEISVTKTTHRINIPPSDYLICLDEVGKQMGSKDLATKIAQIRDNSSVRIVFLIGGPYGLDDELKQRANFVWSLSKLTFPSELAWTIVCEQIYRAISILSGSPYHHE